MNVDLTSSGGPSESESEPPSPAFLDPPSFLLFFPMTLLMALALAASARCFFLFRLPLAVLEEDEDRARGILMSLPSAVFLTF